MQRMAKTATKGVLTPQSEDFPRWYQDVVAKAELAENGAVRGTMIIKPWGYALWERIQAELDQRIKATGHDNVYFPLFIPYHFLQKESEHVEGFSPELAVVTTAGGEELSEPLVVRPTSETVIGDAMARWVQGYRDLPLLLNQWANVVRWELRPRVFLRTTEFLWQEGHTAHATAEEAAQETLMILRDVYDDVVRNVMAIPSVLGRKTDAERFAGARSTYALEALMRDGKALQMGTSHDLGQNFAKAFGIEFTDANGERQFAYTTSWGVSTRTVGGLIMAHGDDRGLRLPPALAPIQVVVLAIKDEAVEAAERLTGALEQVGVRARLDANTSQSFGRRSVDWELKGVPIRLELGPRDLAEGQVIRVRRDRGGKEAVSLEGAVEDVTVALDEIQRSLHDEALAFREGHTRDADSGEEVDGMGFWRVPWDKVGVDGEATLAERGYSVRCLTTPDGEVPAADEENGLIAWIARAY
jgi:prolyl-tRNA synthetase